MGPLPVCILHPLPALAVRVVVLPSVLERLLKFPNARRVADLAAARGNSKASQATGFFNSNPLQSKGFNRQPTAVKRFQPASHAPGAEAVPGFWRWSVGALHRVRPRPPPDGPQRQQLWLPPRHDRPHLPKMVMPPTRRNTEQGQSLKAHRRQFVWSDRGQPHTCVPPPSEAKIVSAMIASASRSATFPVRRSTVALSASFSRCKSSAFGQRPQREQKIKKKNHPHDVGNIETRSPTAMTTIPPPLVPFMRHKRSQKKRTEGGKVGCRPTKPGHSHLPSHSQHGRACEELAPRKQKITPFTLEQQAS